MSPFNSSDVLAPAAQPQAAMRRWIDLAATIAAITAAVWLVFVGLNGDRLNGDEHNAIVFLKDNLWDYIRSFHYGHAIKVQVWTAHELFGNSFFWYRLPAALCAVATLAWMALFRIEGFPLSRTGQALVVVVVAANASFLHFARWGMAGYAETILACTLLVGLVLKDVVGGRRTEWGPGGVFLIAVLPWLYPASIILLGAVSAYLLLEVAAHWRERRREGFARIGWTAGLPLLLGLASLLAYRLSVPDEHWNRARGHHKAFSAWVDQGQGGAFGFVWESLARVGVDFKTMMVLSTDSKLQSLMPLYAGLVWLLAGAVVLALALCLVRAWRLRGNLPAFDRRFARGAAFLVTVLVAALAVTNAAALLDAFPIGSLRYLFFLITVPALLAIVALTYLAHLAAARLRAATLPAGLGMAAGAAVVVFAVLLTTASYYQRRLERAKYRELVAILQSPETDVFLAWSPGFYFALETLPGTPPHFQTEHGPAFPGGMLPLLKNAAPGDQLTVITHINLVDGEGKAALARLMQDYGLSVRERARYGPYEAIALQRTPAATPVAQAQPAAPIGGQPVRSIEVAIDLPASNIVAIRLDPTLLPQATATIDSLVYTDSKGAHPVNVCADPALASMRTRRQGSGSSCSFVFGDGSNSGWIGPSALKNLGSDSAPRRLQVRVTGQLSDEFRVYLDTGAGYSSPIRVKVDGAVAR